MNKDKLIEIQNQIDEFLKGVGVPEDKVAELTKKLMDTHSDKKKQVMAAEFLKDLFLKPAINEKKLIEAIKEIRIEPKIIVEPPRVDVKTSEPKVIIKESPKPKIVVRPPKIELQERPFPKEMKVKGFDGLIKMVSDVVKKEIEVRLKGISTVNPLPVVPIFEGKEYKAIGGGGGPSRVFIKNADGRVTSLLSEGHSVVVATAIAIPSAGTPVQLPDIECKRVWIEASEWNGDVANCPNGGAITLGDVNVVGTPIALRNGRTLYPTGGDWFFPDNLNKYYADSVDDGAKVTLLIER